jgi:hypothetical protein
MENEVAGVMVVFSFVIFIDKVISGCIILLTSSN